MAREGVIVTGAYRSSSPCVTLRAHDQQFTRTDLSDLFPFEEAMLFDRRRDPYQTTNLALHRESVTAELDGLMQDWLQITLGHHSSAPDPMQEVVGTGSWKYVGLEYWIDRLGGQGRDFEAQAILQRLVIDAKGRNRYGYMPAWTGRGHESHQKELSR
jgi:hypothetical protein